MYSLLAFLSACLSWHLRRSLSCPGSKAYGFYDDINKVLDFYIGLVPPETKAAAEKLLPAKREPLPKFLFKEKSAIMREKVAIS